MTNPNPFVPKGSLLEQSSQRRFQLKVAVGCVLTVSVLGLVVMLIQGCKREAPNENNPLAGVDTNPPVLTSPTLGDTNPIAMPPMPTNPPTGFVIPPVAPPVVPEALPGSTYEVVKGDTLTTIAKAHHVSLKELQAANPGVDSKHLNLKKKITIPAAKAVEAASAAVAGAVVTDAGGELYTIKSGDTLDKIAKAHHTTAKAIQAANNLTTTKIIVGHKLKLPAKAEVTPVAPAVEAAPLVVPMIPAPAPAPAK